MATPPCDAIRDEFLASGNAAEALAVRTALVERTVLAAFEQILAPVCPSNLAALAVGGFGRRELFPHSDVDVLLVAECDLSSSGGRTALSEFVKKLWDEGLRLSQSVRTLEECSRLHQQNIELNVSLLDERFLAGDRALHQKLEARLAQFARAEGRHLARHLCRLTRGRHEKFQDTIYHLEPDIKDGPGGIRDLHVLHWLGRLSGKPAESSDLEAARNSLSAVRCFLHYRAGRDSNRLSFDLQEEAAALPCLAGASPAAWMREYYRHARSVQRAATEALEQVEEAGSNLLAEFRAWRSRLSNAELTVSREKVYLKNPGQLDSDPDLALRLYQFSARHGVRPAPETERRILAAPSHADLRWPALKELLRLPHAAMALRAMHESGFLKLLMPEWARIECLVVRDFHHRYTVDEHSLVAIRELEQFPGSRSAGQARFGPLMEEVAEPELLALALLFHDLGKSAGTANHVAESVRLAAEALRRLEAPEDARRSVLFLVQHHLDLSAAMNSRDPADPATARLLAHQMETVENLRALTLVSYADSSAVHPGAMTPWRMEQLWRLYVEVYNELTRELDAERIEPPVTDTPGVAAFLAGFPTRYLRTHSAEEVNQHYWLHQEAERRGAALELAKVNGAYKLMLATRDRPFLFATLCGVLSGFGMNILKAEAFANRRAMVLDTFVFADPSRTLELNPPEVERFKITLERAALGKFDAKQMLRNRPRPRRPSLGAGIRAVVSFNQAASESSTLVEVVAEDRPGLLHDLAAQLSEAGCNIEVVLVDTEAHKALDVFYITSGGRKITPELEARLRQALLEVCRS